MMIIHWLTILTISLYNCPEENQVGKFAVSVTLTVGGF
jgi:hypothetical protein